MYLTLNKLSYLLSKSSLGKIYKQYSARARMSTLNSARATAQRRQTKTLSTRDRLYSDHEYMYVKRQQQNTTVTLQTKRTKRGNTDCRHFSKMRSIEFATKRGKFTVKIIFFDAMIGSKNYTICKNDTRSIFPTDCLFTVLQ